MKKNSGFNLLELVIVLALVAIVVSIAIPSMRTFSQNDRLITNINSMVGHLAYARSEAVKRSQQVSVCVSSDSQDAVPSCTGGSWEDGWVVYIDADANGTFDSGNDTVIKTHAPLVGNNTLSAAGVGTQITYNNRGFLASNTGSLVLCDDRSGNFGKTLSLSPIGRVRMEIESPC
ncbi:MAG: prepilin-type N-terminal cleavage/methylation domain-containing protein [Gammaproteobacteria bacterium]|nr:prepilin-type N-terminal cleavage/methylation domain-containing protein [Gammaproteobacteria bacterium]